MFELNPQLKADCFEICDFKTSKVLLLNDARFLWVVLVPRIENAVELHNLDEATQAQVFAETMKISKILGQWQGIDKINIGAIGNVVSQLHIHIIGRKINDSVWPSPVWGNGTKVSYDKSEAMVILTELKEAFA